MSEQKRIFLGHASEDKPEILKLYRQLKAEGFSPWLDKIDLLPGQNWEVEIARAIEDAAIFLACLSKKSVTKRGFVQREFRHALSALAKLPPGVTYLIPVRLNDCEVPDLQISGLELKLRSIQWVDLFELDGFARLVQALQRSLESGSASNPSASPTPIEGRQKFEIFRDIDARWCPEMVMVPAGSFLMGSPELEVGRSNDEGPQHEVTISKPFAIGRNAVTFEAYVQFCIETRREKPRTLGLGGSGCPVINVNWYEANAYCAWLSKRTGETYCLPLEAEWEYVCRAETITPYAFGEKICAGQANFGRDQETGELIDVDSSPANNWGVCDMHGNVFEWCADGPRTYKRASAMDPKGPNGSRRVVRGGSWYCVASALRSAARYAYAPDYKKYDLGFRCARILDGI